jgi:hypothetical protein
VPFFDIPTPLSSRVEHPDPLLPPASSIPTFPIFRSSLRGPKGKLGPNTKQFMGMLVNLEGHVFTLMTASDRIAIPLLRSGMNFSPSNDHCLCYEPFPLERPLPVFTSTLLRVQCQAQPLDFM